MGRKIYDWSEVQRFVDEGHGFVDAQKRFGFSHTAWIKAIKREKLHAGERPFEDRRRRYDWAAVQAYYDEGHSIRDCARHFGFCLASWTKAADRGDVRARPSSKKLETVMWSRSSRHCKKARLLREGILENRCSECGLTSWRGRAISIQIDHINGEKDDWRLANLRMLCPNCHAQTHTFGGLNAKRRRGLQDSPEVM
jgi:5-methylcytosine-specific restriction endonuclease McrA